MPRDLCAVIARAGEEIVAVPTADLADLLNR
jgi:hypothetical protein